MKETSLVQSDTLEDEIDYSKRTRILPKSMQRILFTLMFIYAIYFLYAAGYQPLPGIMHRSIHITGGLVFALLLYPAMKRFRSNRWALVMDVIFSVITIVAGIYVFSTFQTFSGRVGLPATTADVVFGVFTFVIMFEVARRAIGWAFPIVTALFVAFALLGSWIPEPFTHAGYDLPRFISTFFLTTHGLYGMITGVSADYIVIFIMFATYIRYSGTGELFRDLALSILGKVRGGPGKIAVVASSLMGMLTGSSIANVAAVGSFTIPMMKRAGYRSDFAGGVEANSGMGAQIMPPIMGGSVFIMMEILGIPYIEIAFSCFLIGILFYLGLFMMVDFEAVKKNLRGLENEEIPKFWSTIKKGWYNLIPIMVLIYMLAVVGVSPARAGFWGVISSIVLMLIIQRSKKSIKQVGITLVEGIRDSLVIISVVGLASLIAGIISVSGLGLNLSNILIDLSGGHMLVLLFITAISSIILGMGVPVLVAYSVLAVLVAPALIEMGINPMAAHLFIFYFGVISAITPPVAPDAFVAAGIAKADPFKVAWQAVRLAAVLYIVPFLFVYNEALLFKGAVGEIVFAAVTAAIGTYCLATTLQGVILPRIFISWWERIIMGLMALALIIPDTLSSIIGLLFVVCFHIYHLYKLKLRERVGEKGSIET